MSIFTMLLNIDSNTTPIEAPIHREEREIKKVWYLAAPQNLNPSLRETSTSSEDVTEGLQTIPETSSTDNEEQQTKNSTSFWDPESVTIDFRYFTTNFEQDNLLIQPSITGTLPNGDRLSLTSGFNRFQQPEIDSIQNIPLQFDWEGKIAGLESDIGTGIDWFDRVTPALSFRANSRVNIGERASLSFFVEHAPYKFNAKTVENEITNWRYGPNLFWQISPDTSFFSLVRWGRYSDGNHEQQSFSRLEHTSGEFQLAANLFNWRYREDKEIESGYFSPEDFLVINGELIWNKNIFSWLDCNLSTSVGRQRLQGQWDFVYGYGGRCTTTIAEDIFWDLDYRFSNVLGDNSNSRYNSETWRIILRVQL
ncbi:conserved hypothetical protein [Picosynechococcus sp. PCC 7002]|uniref:hypothetical protein n=2 Tax=Cyanophyceae TaxID=3028117 RepID=UPI00016DCCBA|nr:hypothetical protein [Picosynechococcus sp. PCC 7002]ACB00099.1 conserved hypothetical protein [Picosynechococcus sp. PCC 7002]